MSRRILLLVIGLILGYAAIYLGDGVNGIILNDSTPILVLPAIIATVFWVVQMKTLLPNKHREINETDITLHVIAFVLLSYVFGACAGPFTKFGPFVWYWKSRWDILLLAALTPLILITHNLVIEIIETRRAKKARTTKAA